MTRITRALLLSLVALALLAGATGLSTAPPPKPTGETAQPVSPPPGPHLILAVPLALHNLPPEVTEYQVTCTVWATSHQRSGGTSQSATSPPAPQKPIAVGTQPALGRGSGTAHGQLPSASLGRGTDVDVEVSVGVFANPADAHSLSLIDWYHCELTLQGTAYQATVDYLNATATIPLASGAPYTRVVEGPIP